MQISPSSRQPIRPAWTLERLVHERSILLGMAIDTSTHLSYTSALNSYLTFCKLHNLDIDPTPETLSLFIAYQSTFINPKSVDSYLSGIANQMETFFPHVRRSRNSALVSRTLKGAKRRYGTPIHRKSPLSLEDLKLVYDDLKSSSEHDDLLFLSQLLVGFHVLLRLAELCFPDNIQLRDYSKISLRSSVRWLHDAFSFWLPSHKSDPTFEGSRLIVQKVCDSPDPYLAFANYLRSRDRLFTFNPELWLRSNGQVPTRSWFIRHLARYFPKAIAGQSMRSGGATNLAINGVPPPLIQAAGRWSSEAFRAYARKNPFLLHALLFGGRAAHDHP
jgi:hypothetical protein